MYFTIPVFNWFEGHFACIYQRQYIDSARRFAEVSPLTAQQRAALDMLDACANDPSFHIEIDFHPGDIQLVNNHVLLHDRTAFEDWPEPARRRHLLRLWLAPAAAQPLPPVFAQRFGSVIPGERGGVSAPRACWNVPLDAQADWATAAEEESSVPATESGDGLSVAACRRDIQLQHLTRRRIHRIPRGSPVFPTRCFACAPGGRDIYVGITPLMR